MIIDHDIVSFIEKYVKLPGTIGVFWGGSSSGGKPEPFSDIDLFIVTDDTVPRQAGLHVCESGVIDYFVNPISRINRQMEEEIETIHDYWAIKIYAFASIVFASDNRAQKLQDYARKLFRKPFAPPDRKTDLLNHYVVYDTYNSACKLFYLSLQWRTAYYSCMKAILHAVCYRHSVPLVPWLKAERLFTDEEYRLKYHLKSMPPEEFVILFLNCLKEQPPTCMKENLDALYCWCISHSDFNPADFHIDK